MDRAIYRLKSKGQREVENFFENPPSLTKLGEFLKSSDFVDGFKMMQSKQTQIIDEAKKYMDILNVDKESEYGQMAHEGIKMAETLSVITEAFSLLKTDL